MVMWAHGQAVDGLCKFRVAWEICLFLDGGGAGAFGEFVNYLQIVLGIFDWQLDGR
jgi:hypothetical protein